MRITQHPILDSQTARTVCFTFDGKTLVGRDGEMVSSALFANGVRTFSRHKVDDAPQGIFCANGQCAQCTVLINGLPVKSCITPLREGMEIRTLVHYPELPADDRPRPAQSPQELSCDVLVVGAGPSGITAAVELADAGYSVILVDDKDRLGGKLVLQTHKFFGSMADCYAGTRGTDIARILEEEVRKRDKVTVMTGSVVAGLFADGKAGIYQSREERYVLVSFKGVIVAAGARERSLVFPGNDLPGVFGAGAFQTLVNRDLIQASQRVLIVGCGNVGLIAAYHALQAGINVVGLIDIAPKVTGYKVHADKIRRMGVPIYLNHTIISASGEGRVERATIAQVDEDWNPLLETAKTFAVDTVLIAVGLSSIDEFYNAGVEAGFPVLKTGDASEIAEASSAMMGGRITGREMARMLGSELETPPEWFAQAEILKSPPGEVFPREHTWPPEDGWQPVIHCYEEIPCNPCTTVCPHESIKLSGRTGTIMDLPEFSGKCIGCGMCVLICPGLAITLVRESQTPGLAEVVIPFEFDHSLRPGDKAALRDLEGRDLGLGTVRATRFSRKHRTHLITLEVEAAVAAKAAGILVQDPAVTQPLPEVDLSSVADNAIVCRCERISVGQIKQFVQENEVRDLNQLKQIRAAMGACGGKTCLDLLPRVLVQAGVPNDEIRPATYRPPTVELPMKALANQGGEQA